MFALKREQRQRIGEPAFVERTVEHFERFYRKHVYLLSREELTARVVYGIARARGYGLTWESSITVFVAHMITIHPSFDEQPEIHMTLLDPDIEPNERMPALLALPDSAWDEAEARPGRDTWPVDATDTATPNVKGGR